MAEPQAAMKRLPILSVRTEPAILGCSPAGDVELRLPRYLASFLGPGHVLEFPEDPASPPDQFVALTGSHSDGELLFCPLGYVTRPKDNRLCGYYLRAAVPNPSLGIESVSLSSDAVRNYFYRARSGASLYTALGASPNATSEQLRLAYRVTALELGSARTPKARQAEHAFNILAQPDLRACHDAVLLDPDKPVLFPFSGFGTILVAGNRSPDRSFFFASRILSFVPNWRARRFRAAFRRIDFRDAMLSIATGAAKWKYCSTPYRYL